jgi:hypothetical protein
MAAAFNTAGRDILGLVLNLPGVRVPGDAPRPGEVSSGARGRDVLSRFGRVRLENRSYYHDRTTREGRFPKDDALRLQGPCTPAAARLAVACAVKEPFAKAVEPFRKAYSPEMTPDILKKLVRHIGPRAASFFKHPPPAKAAPGAQAPACCAVVPDGTGVPMRRKHLRGVKGRGPGAKAKTREAKLGVIFDLAPQKAAVPAPGAPAAFERVKDSTRYVAMMARTAAFGKLLRGEYDRSHPVAPGLTLFLGDGAKWVWELRRVWFPHAAEILDYWHAVENLGPLLDLAGFTGKARKNARRKWARWFKEGKVDQVIAQCEALAKGADAAKAKAWRRAIGYFRNNRGRMEYDEYLAKGWIIGSGVVESGCKTVVGARFKQSGMRWSRPGLDALLPIRAAHASGRYDELWEHILLKRKTAGVA